MRAAVHVVPCSGVLADAGANTPSGISAAGLKTAAAFDEPCDLVLIAVPAGQGRALADRLLGTGRLRRSTIDDRAPATAHWQETHQP